MNLEDMRSAVENLKTLGEMVFFDPATEEQIDKFEKENNVNLPEGYKKWLLLSDGGECFLPGGMQLYGVAHKPLIDINCEDRPEDKYIVIGALASGDPLLCEKEGERISIYNLEAGRIEEDEVYEDFLSYINDLPNVFGIGG